MYVLWTLDWSNHKASGHVCRHTHDHPLIQGTQLCNGPKPNGAHHPPVQTAAVLLLSGPLLSSHRGVIPDFLSSRCLFLAPALALYLFSHFPFSFIHPMECELIQPQAADPRLFSSSCRTHSPVGYVSLAVWLSCSSLDDD